MNNYDNNAQNEGPDAADFLGGNYLKKEDLDGAITVTVTNVWSEAVLNGGRSKLVASFREFEKPLILNKTNIKRFADIFRTGKTQAWRGEVTLYVEESVEYGGRVVGGIRVRPANGADTSRGDSHDRSYSNGQTRAGAEY